MNDTKLFHFDIKAISQFYFAIEASTVEEATEQMKVILCRANLLKEIPESFEEVYSHPLTIDSVEEGVIV
tara:strand:+ start:279 stop:488 length:210 start_codon:yes stop_codon:yes gene_type:complete